MAMFPWVVYTPSVAESSEVPIKKMPILGFLLRCTESQCQIGEPSLCAVGVGPQLGSVLTCPTLLLTEFPLPIK